MGILPTGNLRKFSIFKIIRNERCENLHIAHYRVRGRRYNVEGSFPAIVKPTCKLTASAKINFPVLVLDDNTRSDTYSKIQLAS